MTRSYCVVGGGISGLTAAYRLRQSAGDDATITLFDPADRLGGVLRTEQGWVINYPRGTNGGPSVTPNELPPALRYEVRGPTLDDLFMKLSLTP